MSKQTNKPNGKTSRKPARRGPSKGSKPDKFTKDNGKRNASSADINSHANPFELYSKNALLIANASKLNTNNPLGVPYTLFTDTAWRALSDDGVLGPNINQPS